MLFKRRNKQSLWRRGREILWPRSGWKRTFKYIKYRLIRLPHSTHDIAMGMAAGAVVSWTPVFGFHILQCFIFCKIFRANFLASVLGTTLGNPWTFPFLLWISYQVGRIVINLFASDFDYIDDTETTQASFYSALIVLGDFIKLGVADIINYCAHLMNLESVIHYEMKDIPISDLTNYSKVIFLPMLVGGYIMVFLTFPLFYYGFYYMVKAARAAKMRVSSGVHNLIDKRREKKEITKEEAGEDNL